MGKHVGHRAALDGGGLMRSPKKRRKKGTSKTGVRSKEGRSTRTEQQTPPCYARGRVGEAADSTDKPAESSVARLDSARTREAHGVGWDEEVTRPR